MNKYQIVELGENNNHAGTKAPADIMSIAEKMGYMPLTVALDFKDSSFFGKVKRQVHYMNDYKRIFQTVAPGSLVFMQHPYHHKQVTRTSVIRKLKSKKAVKYISIVHDVEELREYRYNNYYKHEFSVMLEVADVIIVHNQKMLEWFASNGYPKTRMVSLDIFDYIQDNSYKHPIFDRSITVAGNLDVQKSRYISELKNLSGVDIHLYGPNFDQSMTECSLIHYHGSFPSSEIPSKLTKGFGLVWDGESITQCNGPSGEYLKYNNPHKLSLYLSSGLPVVIWKEAAEADFVKNNNLGVCVGSLYELEQLFNQINIEQYEEMANNVERIRKNLISGYYANAALSQAEEILSKDITE